MTKYLQDTFCFIEGFRVSHMFNTDPSAALCYIIIFISELFLIC